MVLNLNPVRMFSAAVIGPANTAGQNIFRALEPFKANHRRSCGLRLSEPNAAPREMIDLLTRDRGLRLLGPAFQRDAGPRIRDIGVELVGKEPADNAPGLAAQLDRLLTLPEA
ncbi:hypothetical protein CAK95_00145 [Pseudorhodoplanes sinuspersici]|uniref:Uncharacterized protein n=1 Tax=Pseudorhodoplanes sinuspersici TaxID=1235591 RepID=A0A1W6ZK04_9HYPH|nr:hypothetical protein CAK95_00145 [Pseudorhodoplanes sinuspersici]